MTTKIAISLPDEQVAAAKEAVTEGRAPSVSAYVSAALGHQEREDAFASVLAEMRSEIGEPSEEDYAWARQALGIA